MLPATERLRAVDQLIKEKQYFVIHAARQSGKTTLLKSLAREINATGNYHALYCSLESVQPFTDPHEGIPGIMANIRRAVKYSQLPNKASFGKEVTHQVTPMINEALSELSQYAAKPLVMLFDEVDSLSNGTLITFLRQLRDGYVNRGEIPFLHSVALVGMRNIRDYKGKVREGQQTPGSASLFNMVTKSLTLSNFTKNQVQRLYHQHTQATGQSFTSEAIDKAYYYSQGQPWLVNALAREVVAEIQAYDNTQTVTPALIEQAAEHLMQRRDTHIDSLLERLKEERVQRVVEPVITGSKNFDLLSDGAQYCLDLGLLTTQNKRLEPANPICREVIIRALSYNTQFHLQTEIDNQWVKNNPIDRMA